MPSDNRIFYFEVDAFDMLRATTSADIRWRRFFLQGAGEYLDLVDNPPDKVMLRGFVLPRAMYRWCSARVLCDIEVVDVSCVWDGDMPDNQHDWYEWSSDYFVNKTVEPDITGLDAKVLFDSEGNLREDLPSWLTPLCGEEVGEEVLGFEWTEEHGDIIDALRDYARDTLHTGAV